VSSSGLDEAAEALAAGTVIAVPTDTVYGLAVVPGLQGAAERVFALKGRPELLALPVLIADPDELDDLAVPSPAARRLVVRYWPGPLTLVLARRPGVSFGLGGDADTIGLRCPRHGLVRELLRRTGPLAVTSANRHGDAPLHSADEVRRYFGDEVAAVLDGGRCDGVPSTVFSLAGGALQCLREGAIASAEVAAVAIGPGT